MRRTTQWLVATLLVAAPTVAHAQMQWGAAAGMSMSTFTGDLADDAKNYTSILAGVFARLGTGSLTIEPGAWYAGKGAKFEDENLEGSIRLTYLQVPVLVKASFPAGTTSRVFVGAGPALGVKMGCKIKAGDGDFSFSTDCENLEDEEGLALKAKSTEFSAIATAGIEFGRLGIGVRGDFGLTNAFEAYFGDVSVEPNVKNRTFSLYGSLAF